VEIDSTNMEGAYRLDISDTIVATEGFATIFLQGATNMAPVTIRIAVTDPVPEVDVTQWNGTAVATPDAAGHPKVTIKDGTGQGELNITSGATDANVTSMANDVITAAAHDESTAFPITSVDSGSTQIARTGADGDTLETLSDQMDGLLAAPGSGSRPYTPTTITVDSGTGASGDADDMEAAGDGNVYTVNDDAGTLTLTLDYQFDEDGQAIEFQLVAAAQGIGDDIDLQFYDVDGTTWDTKETITGANLLIYRTFDRDVVAKYTSQSGLFKARLTGTGLASATLTIDKAVAYAVTTTNNANYSGGFIYYDAGASNTNTVPGKDGTDRFPVSTWTAVKSLVASIGLKRVDVVGDLTLDATAEGLVEVRGHGGVLALGTQDIGGVLFGGFNDVTGIGTTTNGNDVGWNFCVAGDSATATIPPSFFRQSQIGDNGIIFGSSGNWNFWFCGSKVDGLGAPVINTNSTDNNNIGFTDWARGKQLTNLSDNDIVTCNGDYNTLTLTGGTPTVNVSGMYGTLTTTGLVSASGVTITNAFKKGDIAATLEDTSELQTNQGNWLTATVVDLNADQSGVTIGTVNLVGANGITSASLAVSANEEIADYVWDEILTAATHNIATSAGRRLRDIASGVVWTGDAVSSTVNTITLDATASAADGAYDPAEIIVTEGTGAGQVRHVYEYFGSAGNGNPAKTAVVDRDWKVQPDATSKLSILAVNGNVSTNEGQLRGGSTTTAVLNDLASSTSDIYNGQTMQLRASTGQDQAPLILDYDGPTKTVTFEAVSIAPDSTTTYQIIPVGTVTVDAIRLDTQSAIDLKDFADNGYDPGANKVNGVKLVDVTTTVTDGAKSVTALTNATWTDARAGYLDNINGHTPQTGDGYLYLVTNLGLLGVNATEVGGTGDHLTALIGANSDTHETLSDQLDTIQIICSGSGSTVVATTGEVLGQIFVTYTDTIRDFQWTLPATISPTGSEDVSFHLWPKDQDQTNPTLEFSNIGGETDITIVGQIVTVTITVPADTKDGVYSYAMRDETNDNIWAYGTCIIHHVTVRS
jgi:hypothetical protein